MSVITVEVCRYGHGKKRFKLRVRKGMEWQDFLKMACEKVGIIPALSGSVKVTDEQGHSLTSTYDLKEKRMIILRDVLPRENEPVYQELSKSMKGLLSPQVQRLPKRAHSFACGDVSAYSTVVDAIQMPVAVHPHHIYRSTHPRPPTSPVKSSPMFDRMVSMPCPPSSATYQAVSQVYQPRMPPPQYGQIRPMSPQIPRHGMMPTQSPLTMRRDHSGNQGMHHSHVETTIIPSFVCKQAVLAVLNQTTDSFVALAQSKDKGHSKQICHLKAAFIQTDITNFCHPFENEVKILHQLRSQSNGASSSYVPDVICTAYCKSSSDFSLLHRSLQKEITVHFGGLLNTVPGKIFLCAFDIGLASLADKAANKDPPTVLKYGVQIAKCLLFLQQFGIIHRSLNLNKFKITSGGKVKLTDFHDSVSINSRTLLFHYRNVGPFGTNLSMMDTLAPEVLNTHSRHEVAPRYPDDTVDYSKQNPWAFGFLFNILATGNHPLPGYPNQYGQPGQVNYWQDHVRSDIPSTYPPEVQDCIRAALAANPNHRPSLPQIISTLEGKPISRPSSLANSQMSLVSQQSPQKGQSLDTDHVYAQVNKDKKKRNRRSLTQPVKYTQEEIMQAELSRPLFQPPPNHPHMQQFQHQQVPTHQGPIQLTNMEEKSLPHAISSNNMAYRSKKHLHGQLQERRMVKSVYDVRSAVSMEGRSSLNYDSTHELPTIKKLSHSSLTMDNAAAIQQPSQKSTSLPSNTSRSPEPDATVIAIEIPEPDEGRRLADSVTSVPSQSTFSSLPPNPTPSATPRGEGPPPYLEACKDKGDRRCLPTSHQLSRKAATSGVVRRKSFDGPHVFSKTSPNHQPTANRKHSQDSVHSTTTMSSTSSHNTVQHFMLPSQHSTSSKVSPKVDSLQAEVQSGSNTVVMHGVITNEGSSGGSSASSVDDGKTVPVDYFPSCFSTDEDVVFSDAVNSGSNRTKFIEPDDSFANVNAVVEEPEIQLTPPPEFQLTPPLYNYDTQRSQSLNRGLQSGHSLESFKRTGVSARGPQTRSVYDLREEENSQLFVAGKVVAPQELQKACGHKCMIQDENVCCLCKKNASWTFCDSNGMNETNTVAIWSKGCHMCRRRVSELNKLSTVSRPRIERKSDSSPESSPKPCTCDRHSPCLLHSQSRHGKTSQRSPNRSKKTEKGCCIM